MGTGSSASLPTDSSRHADRPIPSPGGAEFPDYSFLDRVSFTSKRAAPLVIEKRANGFKAELWGRRDSVVISVPPEYIEGLLARMENRAPVGPGERKAFADRDFDPVPRDRHT